MHLLNNYNFLCTLNIQQQYIYSSFTFLLRSIHIYPYPEIIFTLLQAHYESMNSLESFSPRLIPSSLIYALHVNILEPSLLRKCNYSFTSHAQKQTAGGTAFCDKVPSMWNKFAASISRSVFELVN